ncbi:unnamed protein product [Protopolystoma xenopodis]|uniref:Uncharacterized protein n=1 Tax=Protopolystoma xenopodis TaxID=117903 RepID=A0A448XPD9_9PLAT|nr:unnamed protein product [Protopolystoma xenopodis]
MSARPLVASPAEPRPSPGSVTSGSPGLADSPLLQSLLRFSSSRLDDRLAPDEADQTDWSSLAPELESRQQGLSEATTPSREVVSSSSPPPPPPVAFTTKSLGSPGSLASLGSRQAAVQPSAGRRNEAPSGDATADELVAGMLARLALENSVLRQRIHRVTAEMNRILTEEPVNLTNPTSTATKRPTARAAAGSGEEESSCAGSRRPRPQSLGRSGEAKKTGQTRGSTRPVGATGSVRGRVGSSCLWDARRSAPPSTSGARDDKTKRRLQVGRGRPVPKSARPAASRPEAKQPPARLTGSVSPCRCLLRVGLEPGTGPCKKVVFTLILVNMMQG